METLEVMDAPAEDIVRENTKPEINQKLDSDLEHRLRLYAGQSRETISRRIAELDQEWDIERTLAANAASVSLLGLFLGAAVSRKWFILPGIVSGFLLNHAVRGWCPPLPLFRSRGVRTRREIEQERYALKMLRGDFGETTQGQGEAPNVDDILTAVRRGARL
jgi:hypothetical protein